MPKTIFVCAQCGYESPRWMGKCPDCGAWNSMAEEQREKLSAAKEKKLKRAPGGEASAMRIDEIADEANARESTGLSELDRALGGGVVEGSLTLIGGDPGIGKSTLLTQLCANMAKAGKRALYVSGEESARQIKLRANRIGAAKTGFYVLTENDVTAIEQRMDEINPDIVVIDSIQTMYLPELASAPGSITQVRESAATIMRIAKASGASVFLVGHVTKDGSIAGPRTLEHMVDTVLYFEGDKERHYRILRAVKNRFGSVNELGMFEIGEAGMIEITNPSEALLSERAHNATGSAVFCAMEGTRPLLTDVQALVSRSFAGNPRRIANGADQARLAMLLAVLEKRAGLRMYDQDVYINVAGGITLTETAADLALAIAIASSRDNRNMKQNCAIMGEIGLAGELRGISHAERRLMECARMGFTSAILPKQSLRGIRVPDGFNAIAAETVTQALGIAFGWGE